MRIEYLSRFLMKMWSFRMIQPSDVQQWKNVVFFAVSSLRAGSQLFGRWRSFQEHVIQVCYPLSLEIVFDDDTILITAGLWFNLWRGYWAEFWWPQYVSLFLILDANVLYDSLSTAHTMNSLSRIIVEWHIWNSVPPECYAWESSSWYVFHFSIGSFGWW